MCVPVVDTIGLRVQRLPYGDLAELWEVLLVLGAPQGFVDPALLRPLWTVVSFTIDFCTGT